MELRARSYTAGCILIAAALMEIFVMAHHPSVRVGDISQAVADIAAKRALSGWVHGILIALMFAIAYALVELLVRRGPARPAMRWAAITYGAGVIFMSGAALVSGFITPGIAGFTPHATAADLAINAQLLVLCRLLNQACANAGAVAMSAGILAFSLDLLGAARGRWVGLLGVVVAAAPALALPLGLAHLDVHGMMSVVLLQAAWYGAIGLAFLRRPTDAWVPG